MILVLDNYDSYVYNLVAYLKELGEEVVVKTPDDFMLSDIDNYDISGILLSPGPGHPNESVAMKLIMEKASHKIPVLGVCLGHQFIATYYGGKVTRGISPMHGKLTMISHETGAEKGIFAGIPENLMVTRYHSLVAEEPLADMLKVTARDEDGVVMGIVHRSLPIYGVQFHPEALQTEYGHELLNNFIRICHEK